MHAKNTTPACRPGAFSLSRTRHVHAAGAAQRFRNRCAAALLPGLLALSPAAAPAPQPVSIPKNSVLARTLFGPVRGIRRHGIEVFRGIPYAAPPVGELRWKPPHPPRPWKAPRNCFQFGPACLQPARPFFGGIYRPQIHKQSEDCLYLNVWTPGRTGRKRPVMVWIHGGGFVIGSGARRVYDGDALARLGVVLVTFNYRLGPFGFLAHPALSAESPHHASGNYGLLDQIAALQWVRNNIAAFGGNPRNVTIFGESAGAMAVGCLLVSPLAKGLFARAVLESGSPVYLGAAGRGSLERAENQGKTILREAGAAPDAANIRSLNAAKILDAAHPRVGILGKGRRMGPVIDGWVLPAAPVRLMAAGKFHHVPVMLGTNQDEATLFASRAPHLDARRYRRLVKAFFPGIADRLVALFPPPPNQDARDALISLITVTAFSAPARLTARQISKTHTPVFLYRFTRVTPRARALGLGATHGSEIRYVFGNLGPRADATDRRLAQAMTRYWTEFARSGRPKAAGFPPWPRYTRENDACLELGRNIRTRHGLDRAACDLIQAELCRRYGIAPP